MRQFFQVFPIRTAVRHELSWTHYRLLMKAGNEVEREFYLKECIECNWSFSQLERQITNGSLPPEKSRESEKNGIQIFFIFQF
jgi:uncharacterized protein with PIN domain